MKKLVLSIVLSLLGINECIPDPCSGLRTEDACCRQGNSQISDARFSECCAQFKCPIQVPPRTPPVNCGCFMVYDPVCCFKKKQYGNLCSAECELGNKAKFCEMGECGTKPPPPTDPCRGLEPSQVCCGPNRPYPQHKQCCSSIFYLCPDPCDKIDHDRVCCQEGIPEKYARCCKHYSCPVDPCKGIDLRKVCCRGGGPEKYAKCCKSYTCPAEPCKGINRNRVCCGWAKPKKYAKCCAGYICPKWTPACLFYDLKFCCYKGGLSNERCCGPVDCQTIEPKKCPGGGIWCNYFD